MKLYSPFTLGKMQRIFNVHSIGNKIETEETCIRVASIEGLETLTQLVFHSDCSQPTRLILKIKN